MNANPGLRYFRVFAFDLGPDNMGMVSIIVLLTPVGNGKYTGRTCCEKLNWSYLIPKDQVVNAENIVRYSGPYVDEAVLADPNSPIQIEAPSTSTDLVQAPSSTAMTTESHVTCQPATVVVRIRRKIIPHLVLIEQQYISPDGGCNLHAVMIQLALMTRFAERYPGVEIRLVGASARKCGLDDDEDKKARAAMIGRLFTATDSEYWNTYMALLSDPQHICDAITMALDHLKFVNLPYIQQQVQIWTAERQARARERALLLAAAPRDEASANKGRGRGRGRGRGWGRSRRGHK